MKVIGFWSRHARAKKAFKREPRQLLMWLVENLKAADIIKNKDFTIFFEYQSSENIYFIICAGVFRLCFSRQNRHNFLYV